MVKDEGPYSNNGLKWCTFGSSEATVDSSSQRLGRDVIYERE